ncbi:YadA-like family protein [Bartonella sp. B30(2025)]
MYTTRITNDLKSSCFSFGNALFLTKMVVLLSSVSPVFASNLAMIGNSKPSTNAASVSYATGSHGSVVLSGSAGTASGVPQLCGADLVVGRGALDEDFRGAISAQEEYTRFLQDRQFSGYTPYGSSTRQEIGFSVAEADSGKTKPGSGGGIGVGYMGTLTGGRVNAAPTAYGVYSIATGCGSYTSGNYSTAFGANATALTGGSMAFGVASLASGRVSTAMGISSEASGESSVALGGLATSKGSHAVAIGTRARAEGAHSIAIGSGENDDNLAESKGRRSIAIGYHATSEEDSSIALGGNATVRVSGGVAIGSGSVSKVAAGVSGYHPMQKTSLNRDTDTEVWKSTAGAFSVGSADNKVTRQIVGVAAGSADTDAVNVAQLKEVQKIASQGWSFTVNKKNPTKVGLGDTINFVAGSENLKIANDSNNHAISFDLAKNISVKNIDLEDVSLSDAGLIIANGPKVTPDGIDAANKKITNVDTGVKDTDAVNVSQLNKTKEQIEKSILVKQSSDTQHITIGAETNGDKIDVLNVNKDKRTITGVKDAYLSAESSEVVTGAQLYTEQQKLNEVSKTIKEMGTNVAQYFGGGASYNDGTWTAPTFKVKAVADDGTESEKEYHNVAEALTEVGTSLVNIESSITTKITNQFDEQIASVMGNGLVKQDEEKKHITIGQALSGYNISIADKDNSQRILSGVKDAESEHDAVNKGQLDAQITDVKGELKTKFDEFDSNIASITETVQGDSLLWSIEDGAFVAQHKNGKAKKDSKITHVEQGSISSDSTDAITGGQIYSLTQQVAKYFGGNASYNDGTWIAPTFTVKAVDNDGESKDETYDNVADALSGIGTSFTNMQNNISTKITTQINEAIANVNGSSLVKQDEATKHITIGKEINGDTINIANSKGDSRILSGVKDAESDHDAVNKGQLDSKFTAISSDLTTKFNEFNASIKNITEVVKGDSLLWSEENKAFVAEHGNVGSKTNSKITHILNGTISSESTDAITGNQIYSLTQQVAQYFGGGASYDGEQWTDPIFKVKTVDNNGTENEQEYKSIAEALTGVGTSLANVESSLTAKITDTLNEQIASVKGEGLVKRDEATKRITIGKEIEGYSINIADSKGGLRILSGVKDAESEHDAVNKGQLDSEFTAISSDLTNKFNDFNKEITEVTGIVKGDSLLWSTDDSAFVADHGDDGSKKNSKITHILNGTISSESTDAITGGQIYSLTQQVAKYFGGDASYNDGTWTAPTFTVKAVDNDGESKDKTYDNVADALSGIGTSFTNMQNNILQQITSKIDQEIANVNGSSLVKQDAATKRITIGKEINGDTISIANSKGKSRILSGVKDAVNNNDAVNKHQLDAQIATINGELTTKFDEFNNNITSITETLQGDSLLWSTDEGAFVAQHKNGGSKTNSKITHLAKGTISSGSTDAMTGGQIYSLTQQVAQYFGGGASYNGTTWQAPTFTVKTVDNNGTESEQEYKSVAEALTGVGTSLVNVEGNLTTKITDTLNEQIASVKGESLVKRDEATKRITIGKDIEGYSINIADSKGSLRILSGVKDAVNNNDAVNKGQLDSEFTAISSDLTNKFNDFNKEITEVTGIVKGDSLLWSTDDSAFVADHGDDGSKKNSKITHILNGTISSESTDAITGGQIYSLTQQVAKYFGGDASYNDGTWTAPTFTVKAVDNDGESKDKTYDNVADALSGIGTSFTNMQNNILQQITSKVDQEIANVNGSSLVKQDAATKRITIGKEINGDTISIANSKGKSRILSGVKDAVNNNDAVNKHQLDAQIATINGELTTKFDEFNNNITSITETLQGDSLLWSTDEGAFVAQHKNGGSKTNSKITHLAKGTISSGSTDAMTGGQIYSLTQQVTQYFGGGASYNGTTWQAPTFKVKTFDNKGTESEQEYHNVASAFEGINSTFAYINKELKSEINNVTGEFIVKQDADTNVIAVGKEKSGLKVTFANVDGISRILSGVKGGELSETSTEAINGSQLYSMGTQFAAFLGGGAGYSNGKWNAPSFSVVQFNSNQLADNIKYNNVNNVSDAFDAVNESMLSINDRIHDVEQNTVSNGIYWDANDGAYSASHNEKDGKITHVADGKIALGSTDAVNGGQLFAINSQVTKIENKVDSLGSQIQSIAQVADNVIAYDKDENGKLSITLGEGDDSAPVLISNVADGEIKHGSTDAVNGGQVYDFTKEQMALVLEDAKKYADERVDDIVMNSVFGGAQNYIDTKFDVLTYAIEDVRGEARQAAAIGLAVSNLRYYDNPGALSVSLGTGLWRNQSAFAVGVGYTSEAGDMRSNLSVTSAGGHWGTGAGITLRLR